jgi:protein TonB
MIASSRSLKVVLLLLAGSAHGALAFAWNTPDPVEIEGSSGAAEVQLGSSFADMAAGTLEPIEAETVSTTAPTKPVKAETVKPVAMAALAPLAATPKASAPVSAQPVAPQVAAPAPTTPTAPSAPASTAKPSKPQTAEQSQPDQSQAQPAQKTIVPTTKAQTLTTVTAAEVLKAEPEPKPKAKPKPKKKKKAKPQKAKKPKAKQGNAKRNAKAGSASGSKKGKAVSRGTGGKKKSAGNAKASNYPGKVMRKIARVRKPNVRARGSALVAFSITSGGGLGGVSIARSSGSAALDRAAVKVVRRAAPFPKPPSGARRNFTVQIKGR